MAQASSASKNVAYDDTARREAFGWSTNCTICLASQVERTLLPAMGAILAEQVSVYASPDHYIDSGGGGGSSSLHRSGFVCTRALVLVCMHGLTLSPSLCFMTP